MNGNHTIWHKECNRTTHADKNNYQRETKGEANTKCDPTYPQKNQCIKHSYLNVLLIAIVYIQSMTIIYHLYSAWQSHYTVPITIDFVLYKYCRVLYNKLELVAI